MTIDELRDVLADDERTDDENVLDFYVWQDAQEIADAMRDDGCDGLAEMLAGWFRKGLEPATISDVVEWLKEWRDGMELTDADLVELLRQYAATTGRKVAHLS